MDGIVYLEVLDRRGQLRARHRLERLPATIGRGYGSDVMLDDRLVDAAHARLVAGADGITLEDLGSLNGVRDARTGARAEPPIMRSGDQARIGGTLIRVVVAGHPVPPAAPAGRADEVLAALAAPRAALAVFAVTLAGTALSSWLGTTERVSAAQSLSGDLVVAFILVVWAGAWAFATRVLSGRFRFFGHLAVAGAATLGGLLALIAEEYLSFLWPDGPGQALLGIVLVASIAVAALGAHLGLASSLPPRRRYAVAAAVAAAVMALGLVSDWADRDEFSTALEFAGALKPLRSGIVPGLTPTDFVVKARELRAEVDSLALAEE